MWDSTSNWHVLSAVHISSHVRYSNTQVHNISFYLLFEEGTDGSAKFLGVWDKIQERRSSLVAQWQRILLPMQETWVWFLSWEDTQEKEMTTHSSILAWEIPWMEEPGRLQSKRSQRVGHDLATKQQQRERKKKTQDCHWGWGWKWGVKTF